ncbi:MAG: 4Fe-4S binding protein [Holophagaceae bacterium]|nr:4Fe-4S binding protein [Holophagaceae bacterium]
MAKRAFGVSRQFHVLRRITQVVLLLLWVLLPWLDIVRIEIQGTHGPGIIYFGHSYPMDFPYVLGLIIPFVVLIWGIALLTYFKGRVFCGWACPYGSCVELFDGLRTAVWRGSNRKVAAWMRRSSLHKWLLRLLAGLTLALAPVVLALSLAAYLVAPRQILQEVFATPWGRGGMIQTTLLTWVALTILISWLAGFAVRFHFCRMVCIYGMGQAMVVSAAPGNQILRPRFLPDATDSCGGCQACLRACFVDLDPRAKHLVLGFSAGCFNCGDCVDACRTVQGHKNETSLLSFRSSPRGSR